MRRRDLLRAAGLGGLALAAPSSALADDPRSELPPWRLLHPASRIQCDFSGVSASAYPILAAAGGGMDETTVSLCEEIWAEKTLLERLAPWPTSGPRCFRCLQRGPGLIAGPALVVCSPCIADARPLSRWAWRVSGERRWPMPVSRIPFPVALNKHGDLA